MPAYRYPDGHFYSPMIDVEGLRERKDELWPAELREMVGVDLDLEGQLRLLAEVAPLAAGFDYPRAEGDPDKDVSGFCDGNGKLDSLDARMLYCMLRRLRPRRLIEVGSGHSSLLSADVNRRHLDSSVDITCIEPFPPEFLNDEVEGIARLIREPVQSIGLEPFGALEAGDILFIDSSHVCKTGSDVNFLYLDVLPRLARGVVIHLHDIFLPREYPQDWVLGDERSWNEQYLLRALLMFSRGFRVLFGCHAVSTLFPDQVREVFGPSHGGGSFWLEKIA